MKTIILLILFFSLNISKIYSQPYKFDWVKKSGIATMTKDNYNNLYIIGSFIGTIDVYGVTLISNGDYDFYVAKLDSNDNLAWIKQFGGIGNDMGNAITCDNNSNIIFTGHYSSTCNFVDTTLINTNLEKDIFIAKFDSSGNRIWAKQLNSKKGTGKAITSDNENNIYISGTYSDTLHFNDTIIFSGDYMGMPIDAGLLVKYDSSGIFKWVRCPSINSDYQSILYDSNNSVYITGSYAGYCDWMYPTISPLLYFAKFNTNGNLDWVKLGNCDFQSQEQSNLGTSLALDSYHNVYLTISNYGKFIFDTIPNLLTGNYMLKFNTIGDLIWYHSIGSGGAGPMYEGSFVDICNDRVFSLSKIYIPNGVGSSGVYLLISEFDTSGNSLWTKQVSGHNSYQFGHKILCKNEKEIYICGNFNDSAYFDAISLYNQGQLEILAKLVYDSLLSIPQLLSSASINVYPNPFNQTLSISIEDEKSKEITLQIFNSEGEILQNQRIPNNSKIITFNFTNYSNGIYYVKVYSDRFIITKKIIKN